MKFSNSVSFIMIWYCLGFRVIFFLSHGDIHETNIFLKQFRGNDACPMNNFWRDGWWQLFWLIDLRMDIYIFPTLWLGPRLHTWSAGPWGTLGLILWCFVPTICSYSSQMATCWVSSPVMHIPPPSPLLGTSPLMATEQSAAGPLGQSQ